MPLKWKVQMYGKILPFNQVLAYEVEIDVNNILEQQSLTWVSV